MRGRRRGALLGLAFLLGAVPALAATKALVLGFDGMDPQLLVRYRAAGAMPTVDRLLAAGWQLHTLGTSVPPQSPVAWSTFITGANPGVHGVFDFIHRDPRGPIPILSQREGAAFWQPLAAAGVDVTIFKVPANYPPVACEARTLAGMGTPDIQGTFGIFTLITDDPAAPQDIAGGQVARIALADGRFTAAIDGPPDPHREGGPAVATRVTGEVDRAGGAVHLRAGAGDVILRTGQWSDWVTFRFALAPADTIFGIGRFHLMTVAPNLRLYLTPIQIDPRRPSQPISTPPEYARDLAEAIGPYYTQGLPEDTKALDAGVLADRDYVQQSDQILAERRTEFTHELRRFAQQDRAFLFFYFNLPDQTCHMFWRSFDADAPSHASADPDFTDRVRDVYAALDDVLREAVAACGDDTAILVMSDHGFAPYHRNVHLNAWLREHGYLVLKDGVDPDAVAFLDGVDWSRTRAYGLGINGLYVNQRGREVYGIVAPGFESAALVDEIAHALEAAVDPGNGGHAVATAYRAAQVYHGPHAAEAPDIVVGYARGWRGSNESALGGVGSVVFDDNTKKWSGDHCMAANLVPGILLSNRPLAVADPDLRDLAPTILARFGLAPTADMEGRDLLKEPR